VWKLLDRFVRIEDAGSGDRLPAADEPTIGVTMPMTDKPVRRDRYPVKGEQKNGVGHVRRDNTRRDVRATSGRAAVILSASFYSDRLHRPRRRECRRALRSRVSPEFHGSPARHCDTLASPPSECRHVILPPRRAAAEIAPGSCQGRVHQPDTVVRPARPKHACTRHDSLLDLRIADNQQSPTLLVFLCQNS